MFGSRAASADRTRQIAGENASQGRETACRILPRAGAHITQVFYS
jgi:hypothetical protein